MRVVGGGLGGLTAAALLADAGIRVAVHEQHEVTGGFGHNWARLARPRDHTGASLRFRFDSGVHDISGWQDDGSVRAVFARLGIEGAVEMRRLDHRFWTMGEVFDPPCGPAAYADALAALHPEDAAGLRHALAEIHDILLAMISTGAERGGIPGPPRTLGAKLAFLRANPLAVTWLPRRWTDFVARHVRGEAARQRLSALGFYLSDRPATLTVQQMTPLFGYFFFGGVYPAGGSGRLAAALTDAIRARGGEVHLGHRVLRILDDGGRASAVVVRDTAGREQVLPAAAVVLNADPLGARNLLPGGGLASALRGASPACSAFAVYLGIRGAPDMPPLVHARTRLGPVEIVAPSLVDPTAAPPGYSTLELMAVMPQAEAATWMPPEYSYPPAPDDWRRSSAYRTRKAAIGDQLVSRAAEVLPDLPGRIVFRADASPATFLRYAWTSCGSIYGADRPLPRKQPLPGLVVAGAATHGPGVEAVMISGADAAEALLPGLLGRKPYRVKHA